MSEDLEQEPASSFADVLRALLPHLALTLALSVVLSAGAVLAMSRFVPRLALQPRVVTFDVFRYLNAQRAVASTFLRPGADQFSASQLLADMPVKTQEAIAAVAGPGTLVVIKQAVVQGETEDITTAVLKKLGLPTNVPSVLPGLGLNSGAQGFTPPPAPAVPPTANSTLLP